MLSDLSKYKPLIDLSANGGFLRDNRYQSQNNFFVRLSDGTEDVFPHKITGFQINQKINEGIFSVKTSLCINDWVDQFKTVEFAEIMFFDSLGNLSRMIEFDISYLGYRLSCDFNNNEAASPIIDYEIIS